MNDEEKVCNRCFRSLAIKNFPRLGKSATCSDCKFGRFNKNVKKSQSARPVRNSALGEGWDML